MGPASWLLCIARAILQQVVSQLLQQINLLEQEVKSPVQRLMQEVVSKGAGWEGQGANEFVREMNEVALPRMTAIITGIGTYRNNILRAEAIIDAADAQANSLSQQLHGIFEAI